MIKIAFCDDEPVFLEQITGLLERYKAQRCPDMEYMAFHSPLELLAEMENGLHPDVLLLDVIMPGESGISAAREIRQFDNDVKIIFLTSSAEFAVQSYTVGGVLLPAQAYPGGDILPADGLRHRRMPESGGAESSAAL